MADDGAIKPRGFWSTAILSCISTPAGGFFWLGRTRLAWLSFFILLALTVVLWSVLDREQLLSSVYQFDSLSSVVGIFAGGFASILVVMPFRRSSHPTGWWAKWYLGAPAALGIALLLSLVSVLLIRTFIVQPFFVPSRSMAPTLLRGDVLWSNKYAYGYSRFSVPFGSVLPNGKLGARLPQRGDVVIHVGKKGAVFIRRVVALPLETVQMIDGVPYVNGVAFKTAVGIASTDPENGQPIELVQETTPEGRSYQTQNLDNDSPGDNTRLFVVPESHYFLMGDNRDNSNDSRFDAGMIPADAIFAKPMQIFANSQGLPFADRRDINPRH